MYLYILLLRNGKYYCGITNNIKRRYKEHTEQKRSWASKVGVIKIVYCEMMIDRKTASIKESKVKRYGVSKFIKYIRINNVMKF